MARPSWWRCSTCGSGNPGAVAVMVACLGVLGLILVVALLVWLVDRRVPVASLR
jgi:hypothetical protein